MEWNAELARTFTLQGRVAVITGAASGIAQETARIFALAGANVVLADVNAAGLAQTARLIESTGGECLIEPTNVAVRDDVEALADATISKYGRLDIWVNGAGISYHHSLLETEPDAAAKILSINMMGAYWGSVAAARIMRERGGGSIINISSGGGAKPLPGLALYGMTKAAVNSLTWTSAAEFGPMGIRVNAVAPGWIETPMSKSMFCDASGCVDEARRDAVRREMASLSVLGTLGTTSDIAHALLYLASDASRFVSGQILAVNGGMSM